MKLLAHFMIPVPVASASSRPGAAAPVAAAGAYALHLSVRLPDALPPGLVGQRA